MINSFSSAQSLSASRCMEAITIKFSLSLLGPVSLDRCKEEDDGGSFRTNFPG